MKQRLLTKNNSTPLWLNLGIGSNRIPLLTYGFNVQAFVIGCKAVVMCILCTILSLVSPLALAQSSPSVMPTVQTCTSGGSAFVRPTRTGAEGYLQNLADYNQNLLVRRRPIVNNLMVNLIAFNSQTKVTSIRIGTSTANDERIWNGEHEKILSNIAAALFAVKEVKLGLVCNDGTVYDKTAIDTFMSKTNAQYAIAKAVETFTASIKQIGIAGTAMDTSHGGDYDFVMREMVSLLYTFVSDTDLLTTIATENIVKNGLSAYMGVEANSYDQKLVATMKEKGQTILLAPETENHVLMTLSSQYLTNQWVYTNPRGSSWDSVPKYNNADSSLEKFLLAAAGRIAHLGPWEANGRTYQVYSFHALNNLASFASSKHLQIAAQNAMDTMSAMFAAQSINGKRLAPYRRSYHYMAGLGLYENDGFSITMGMLSGAYSWPDAQFLEGTVLNTSRVALWNSILGYRLPATVHDFMSNRHLRTTGMWSRMMTRFSKDHYKGGGPALYTSKDDKTIYDAQTYDRTPQTYLIMGNFMNSAGGRYKRYEIQGDTTKEFITAYVTPVQDCAVSKNINQCTQSAQSMAKKMGDDIINGNPVPKDSDFLSRPQTFLPFGHVPNWGRSDNADTERSNMTQYLPAMFGNPARYWMSENDATFKGLSYGYQYYGSNKYDDMNNAFGNTGTDRHLRYPMSIPIEWESYRYHENNVYEFAPDNNQHARARFKFYDLRNAPVKDDPSGRKWGVLLVLARVSKDDPDTKYRSYARGFWEVVPGSRFATVAELKQYVMKYNPSDNYPNKTSDGRHYRYVMTTGETVEMEALIGYDDPSNKDCLRNPIINIWSSGKDWRKDAADTRSLHLFDACDATNKNQPHLLLVSEVTEHMVYTKVGSLGFQKILMSSGSGVMNINNPYIQDAVLNTDSRQYITPICTESAAIARPLNLCSVP